MINTTGLYLTKHGGAVLNSISFSLLLPITTILFSVPLLGEFRESIFPATYVGSSCSSQASPCGATSRRSTTHCSPSSQLARALLLCCKGLNKDASDEPPASFQERFVGIGRFIRRPSHDQ